MFFLPPSIVAQVSPTDPVSAVASGLASNPLAWGLAIALFTIAYLFRQLTVERTNSATKLEAAQTKLIELIRADAAEQREILSQIVPLAAKLTEGLKILADVTDSIKD